MDVREYYIVLCNHNCIVATKECVPMYERVSLWKRERERARVWMLKSENILKCCTFSAFTLIVVTNVGIYGSSPLKHTYIVCIYSAHTPEHFMYSRDTFAEVIRHTLLIHTYIQTHTCLCSRESIESFSFISHSMATRNTQTGRTGCRMSVCDGGGGGGCGGYV